MNNKHTNIRTCQHKYQTTLVEQWLNIHQIKTKLDSNNSTNRVVEAIAGIATQERPQEATMLKPVSTNTLIFDGKNRKFELFEETYLTQCSKCDQKRQKQKKPQSCHLRKEALKTFKNISASNRKSPDDVLNVFPRKYVQPESQAGAKHKWHKLTFDPNARSLSHFLEEHNE